MSTIIDKLFAKRFCLQTNCFEGNVQNVLLNKCLCGNYNHAACVLEGDQKCFEKV